MMLFADDGKAHIPISIFRKVIPALLALFVSFGMDQKWDKIRGGVQFQWIGYWLTPDGHRIGISEKRKNWVIRWITEVLEGKKTVSDFDSAVGRLSFVCSAIIYDRPFLAPLFSHAAAVRRRTGRKADTASLPPYIRFILDFLRPRLMARHTIHCCLGKVDLGEAVEQFRTDAKAEGDKVTIGGYQSFAAAGHEIPHGRAKWFFLRLTRTTAPWAFRKGEPFRTIASLELLGSLMGLILLLDGEEDPDTRNTARLSVSGLTDNAGNRCALARLLTTKWPLMAFVAELAVQIETKRIQLDVSWAPRDQNTEADAITNGDWSWLRKENQVAKDLSKLPFIVLHDLLVRGEQHYNDCDTAHLIGEELRAPAGDPLKVRDSWDV